MATTYRQGNTDPRVVVEDETGIVLCETCPTAKATGEQNAARIAATLNAHGPMREALEKWEKRLRYRDAPLVVRDYACAMCGGDPLNKPGFECAEHALQSALALVRKETP